MAAVAQPVHVREEVPLSARIRLVLSYTLLFLLAAVFLYPFLLAISTSLKSLPEIASNPVGLFPQSITLDGYRRMENLNITRWAFNSAFVATVITVGNLLFASMAGYALARIPFPGSNVVFLSILGTMMVPGIVLLIPLFIILRQLGFIDSYWGLTLPKLVAAFGVFLMKQFFESIPKEMEEAARIDGANRLQMFFRVILPMARPALVALVIFTFQGAWNDFMFPLIVVSVRQELYTLPLGLAILRGALGENLQWNAILAGSLLTTLPMALVFLYFQRYFIEGISYSGIKG
jgi:multiple sugar transport system permease protein